MQARQFHSLVQTVHHIIRQKGCDQIHRYGFRLVSFQIAHLITVHIITHGSITDAIELHIRIGVAVLEFLVCFFHTHGTQGIHILLRDLPVALKAVLHIGGNSAQHTTCGCDTHFCKFSSQILFQLLLHLGNGLSHLTDVMDLSVQHGSGLMLPGALRQHMEFPAI